MGAIGVHHTETDDGAWNGPRNEGRLRTDGTASYYRSAYAWRDPEGDPETKSAYKFIHHFVAADGKVGPASTRACSAGIAVLNGGRGGADIPDGDRRGVYNHLAAHLRDADMEPPDLRAWPEDVERRAWPAAELRVVDGGAGSEEEEGGPRIVGYAALFDELSTDLGGFREIIRRGAFTQTVAGDDVRALWNHNADYVIGRTRAGTLRLAEDERGLRFEAEPPDTQWARDALVSLRRGDVNQMSFGFYARRDRWQQDEEGNTLRELLDVELYDVSPVTYPAYPQTSVAVRAMRAKFEHPAPGQGPGREGPEAEGERQGRLELMRRRLELAEME